MAIRLSQAFGGAPEAWFNMQSAYDLAQARSRARSLKLARVTRRAA